MDERTRQFIDLTPEVEDDRDWRERLLKPDTGSALRLDLLFLGGQSVADIIKNNVTDSSIDPDIIKAYHLQYPELSQHIPFVDEVRKLAGDPDRLRGFFGGVKGKLFEVEYRDYLNDGHLPTGYVAELSAKANEPGVDILIKDSHGQVHQELQAKAFETLQGVKDHIERYPEITPVIIPADQVALANADGLGGYVHGAPTTEHTLDQTVIHAIDQSASHAGIHFPLIGFSFLAGEVAYLLVRGKPVSFVQVMKRGAKMTVATVAGQIAYLLSHSFWVGIPVTITARALIERYLDSNDFTKTLQEKRKWARNWTARQVPQIL